EAARARRHRRLRRAIDDVERARRGGREALLRHLERAGDERDVVVAGLPSGRRAVGRVGADRVAGRVRRRAGDLEVVQRVAGGEAAGARGDGGLGRAVDDVVRAGGRDGEGLLRYLEGAGRVTDVVVRCGSAGAGRRVRPDAVAERVGRTAVRLRRELARVVA